MSREYRNEFIIWMEGQDEQELIQLFAGQHRALYDEWCMQRYEAMKRNRT